MAWNNTFLNVTFGNAVCTERSVCVEYFTSNYTAVSVSIYILSALNILTGVATVLGNSLVFAAYYYTSNMFILSLAATDVLSGFITQPIYLITILLIPNCHNKLCVATYVFEHALLFSVGATLWNLSFVTAERYIANFHSLRYQNLVTKLRATKVIVGGWVTWVLIEIAVEMSALGYSDRLHTHFVSLAIIVNVLFIVVIYTRILREVWRLERVIIHPAVSSAEISQVQQRAHDRKAAKTVGLVIGLLVLFYIPIFVNVLVQKYFRPDVRFVVWLWISSITMSNSTANPILYCWRKRGMRIAMLKVMKKIAMCK